jgi:hypothetical protein
MLSAQKLEALKRALARDSENEANSDISNSWHDAQNIDQKSRSRRLPVAGRFTRKKARRAITTQIRDDHPVARRR